MSLSRAPWPWATTLVALSALGLAASDRAAMACEYSRTAIATGETWRLWTSSLVHYGISHLVWNLLVCVVAGIWVERRAPWELRVYLAAAPLVIGGTLWWLEPGLDTYRGLSGVTVGLVVLTIWRLSEEGKRAEAILLGLLLAAKLCAEVVSNRPLLAHFADDRIFPVAAAHLAGAVVAIGTCCARPLERARVVSD